MVSSSFLWSVSSIFTSILCFCFLSSFPISVRHTNKGFTFVVVHFFPGSRFYFSFLLCMFTWWFIVLCFVFLVSYWFFHFIFGSFFIFPLIRLPMKKHPAGKFFFFPFVVVHVCFGTICLYLQDFNFVYYYACFLLNNSYFFSLIFQLCFWFLFIFRGYRRRSIQQASLFPFCCYACLFHYYLFLFARF